MLYSQWASAISEIWRHFRYTMPDENQIKTWHALVEKIPAEATVFIIGKIRGEKDKPPPNITKAFWAYYYQWREQNSKRHIGYERTECKECGGDGIIPFKELQPNQFGYRSEYIALCAKCENWKRMMNENCGVERLTKFQIENKGYEVI